MEVPARVWRCPRALTGPNAHLPFPPQWAEATGAQRIIHEAEIKGMYPGQRTE